MLEIVLILIASYLLGSFPTALVVGKFGYGVDIREQGSGNLGGTNSFRVLGWKAGMAVSVVDVLKGTLAALLPWLFGVADLHPLWAGLPAVLGHCYPIFAGFRGGKAVATAGGVVLAIDPLLFLIAVVVFFLTLYLWKYVSLASMVAGVVAHLYAILLLDKWMSLGTFALCLFVMYRHRENVERITKGSERRITWM
ncbi:MAG TPA: glycerol-3-phosphate 1-O-acyltransferase PlsY [Bacilli bacterium]|nr:glycerol-3-phosphate 1-O-acyltransferase PlsY [Bacilli bacterium]